MTLPVSVDRSVPSPLLSPAYGLRTASACSRVGRSSAALRTDGTSHRATAAVTSTRHRAGPRTQFKRFTVAILVLYPATSTGPASTHHKKREAAPSAYAIARATERGNGTPAGRHSSSKTSETLPPPSPAFYTP